MDDPYIVLGVDGNANGHALVPVVWQRLRPQRVDFKSRRHDGALSLGCGAFREHLLANGESDHHHDKQRTPEDISLWVHVIRVLSPCLMTWGSTSLNRA